MMNGPGRNGCSGENRGAGKFRPRWAVSMLALLGGGVLMAQSTGIIQFQVEPADYEYVLDHQFRMRNPQVELTPGTHHFSFWAPQRAVVDTNLFVAPDRVTTFTMRLPFAKDYLVYQRELQQFQVQRRVKRIIPATLTGVAMVNMAFTYRKLKQAHDQLAVDRAEYDKTTSPYRIGLLKEVTIPEHKEDFRRANNRMLIATGATVALAGVTAYMFLRTTSGSKPEFIDREKLRFDGLSYEPGTHGGIWMGGLTWNFNR